MATRAEMFARLGINKPIVEPIVNAAYEKEEEQIWRENLQSSPHGEPWHTSFHASSFPGDNPKACGRRAIYTLLNIPETEPINRMVRATGDAGKDIEIQIGKRLERAGVLLSESPDAEHQTGFVDEEHWLTGSPDFIIFAPQINRPHVIEVKCKSAKVIEDMQTGKRSFFPEHRNQALTYIGFVNEENLWPDYDPCDSGSIYYLSRDNPSESHEFKFSLNVEFMKSGKEKLKEWQEYFLAQKLPPRPKSWKWTEHPCKWCPVKKLCKLDDKEGVEDLADSNAVKFAEKTYTFDYNYEKTYSRVLERWQ